MTYAIVYQAGIANLFECGQEMKRVYQGDFRTAESIARGVILAGSSVLTYNANVAGDVALADWNPGTGGPFEDSQRPPSGSRPAKSPCLYMGR